MVQILGSEVILTYMKFSIIVVIALFFMKLANAQITKPKEIYFLADTLNTPRESRIVGIGTESDLHYYQFYCKCLPPYVFDLAFVCPENKLRQTTFISKPELKYTSYPELLQLVLKAGALFEQQYTLYIVEALPNKQFTKNKVSLANGQGG